MITNTQSGTRIDEIAAGIYRISTPVAVVPGGFSFNQYLVLDEQPYLKSRECSSCGALYFDRRNACSRCFTTSFGTRRLATTGTVRAYTIVHRAAPSLPTP